MSTIIEKIILLQPFSRMDLRFYLPRLTLGLLQVLFLCLNFLTVLFRFLLGLDRKSVV